jgi:drug/metabolite transporter (DMT)-like permease
MPPLPNSPAARARAFVALSLTSLLWGTTWIGSKIGIGTGVHPIFFSSVRQLLGGACFLLYFLVRGQAVWPTARQWGYLVLMACVLFVCSNGLTTWGLKYINSGLGAIIGAIAPLFVAIIDWFLGKADRPNAISVVGLVLGFLGVGLVFYEHAANFYNANFAMGIGLSLAGTFTWSLGTVILSRKKALHLNQYYSLGWQMFLAGVLLLLVSLLGGVTTPVAQFTPKLWLALAWMVTMGSILAFGAFLYTIRHLPTTLASVYAYINPIVAVLLGHFLLGEGWSVYLAAGAAVTLLGVYLVKRGFQRAATAAPDGDQA